MIGRIVEIAEDRRHLSLVRGFLRVESGGEELGRVPLDDIGAVVVNAHGVTYSNNIVVGLAQRGVPLVVCGANHAPVAWLWPFEGHHAQTERLLAQASAGKPLAKRLWQILVHAKVIRQASILEAVGSRGAAGVAALARKVRSGDPENIEAQAARRYWPLLMGADFRRDRGQGGGANALLNYGYTVLRAATGRAVVAAGLHPSLGIHHRTRTDAFCLVSDVMEPFRPLVDLAVARLVADGMGEVTPDAKRVLARVLVTDMETARGTTPLATCLERLAISLAAAYLSGEAKLDLPHGVLPLDLAALGTS